MNPQPPVTKSLAKILAPLSVNRFVRSDYSSAQRSTQAACVMTIYLAGDAIALQRKRLL